MDKRSLVSSLLADYFTAVHGPGPSGVAESWTEQISQFFQKLATIGAYSEDKWKNLSHEEILECLPSMDNLKPKVLAKDIAKIFRGTETEDVRPTHVSDKKAGRMTQAELVMAFEPENHTSAVGKRLAELSKGRPFVVFSVGRQVDVETTQKLLDEITKGFQGRELIKVGKDSKRVYCVGELPDSYVNENPLYPGRPLRPDDTCDQLSRSWDGVPLPVRQFIRLIVERNGVMSHDRAHSMLDIALQPNAMDVLKERHAEVDLTFNEREGTGTLPKLKVILGKSNGGRAVATTLAPGKKVVARARQGVMKLRDLPEVKIDDDVVFTTNDDTVQANQAWHEFRQTDAYWKVNNLYRAKPNWRAE